MNPRSFVPRLLMIAGKTNFLANTLDVTGLGGAMRRFAGWRGLVVLNYHRIGDSLRSPLDRGLFSAAAEDFEEQVRWIKLNSDLIGIDDLDDVVADRRSCYSMMTFDDGYRDNYDLAYPILRTVGVPATFFITSGFLDSRRPAWWDELAWMVRSHRCTPLAELPATRWWHRAIPLGAAQEGMAIRTLLSIYKQLPGDQTEAFLNDVAEVSGAGRCPEALGRDLWMSWDMVREMHRHGMGIGGHTVTHPILSRQTAERQAEEIRGGKSRIEAELGATITAFSYPVGQRDSFNATTQQCLRDAGFRWAFSFYGGCVGEGDVNPMDMPRTGIHPGLSPSRFRGLLTWPELFARH